MLTNTISTRACEKPACTPAWNGLSAIERRFPRIASELRNLWSDKEIDTYIDSLLLDDRGDRMGFPIEVLDELMFLAGIRWHLCHLCGTVIDSTLPEEFNFTGRSAASGNIYPGSWVLL
jgi:hypothetical protein